MKEEGERRCKALVSMFVIVGMVIAAGAVPIGVIGVGNPPYYDIEQDSLGNYHKAYINNSVGNYEVYYTNDIGGQYPQDWNPSKRITNTSTGSFLLDLGIYLPTDTMFIIWKEASDNITNPTNLTYYTLSRDYGANWTEPNRSYENITLKYAEFDPLKGEPYIPFNLTVNDTTGAYEYYLVQMKTPMIQEWWDGIEDIGGIFCGYIPNRAFLIWMNESIREEIEQLPYIRWIGEYHPAYKIEPGLLNNSGIIEIRVLVFEETGGQDNLNKTIQEIENLRGNITHINNESYIIRTEIDALKIDDIAFIPEVKWIEEHHSIVSEMSNARIYTGANYIFTNGGYDGCKENGEEHIIGGVSDVGIDDEHTEFEDTLIATYPDPPYEANHGTSTFGIIFSEGSNQPNSRGMLPEGHGIFMDVDEGYERGQAMSCVYCDDGLFLCSPWSEGDYDGTYKAQTSFENDKAVRLYWRTMVYPTGNDGNKVSSDAASKNIISVGGMNEGSDETTYTDDTFWSSSNRGTADDDGRQKPDLVGPASGVYTTIIDSYGTFGDTCAACSVVSGAAGLVYEMYKYNHFGNNPTNEIPMESTVKALLIANAHQYDLSTQASRIQQGWGAVDLERMYDVGDQHYIIDQDELLMQGEISTHNFYVTNAPDLKISLVWRDYEGDPEAAKPLVNDLDLKVTDLKTGDVYWGNNGLHNSLWSSSGTNANSWSSVNSYEDNLNNVENVFIENPTTGNWQIEVIATEVNKDIDTLNTPDEIDQHFALVVSCNDFYKPVTLYPGWNLISLPLIQSQRVDQEPYNYKNSEDLEIVLRSITGYYDTVEYYDASDSQDHWKIWDVNKPPEDIDLWELGHRMGFWIHVIGTSDPITLRVYGWEFTEDQQIELRKGGGGGGPGGGGGSWNMVGYPSKRWNGLEAALNNLDYGGGRDIDSIWYYNAQTYLWVEIEPPTDIFEVGRGYWFHYIGNNPIEYWEVPHDPT